MEPLQRHPVLLASTALRKQVISAASLVKLAPTELVVPSLLLTSALLAQRLSTVPKKECLALTTLASSAKTAMCAIKVPRPKRELLCAQSTLSALQVQSPLALMPPIPPSKVWSPQMSALSVLLESTAPTTASASQTVLLVTTAQVIC